MSAIASTWTIQTEVFEGPLDLLLYLVKRDSIDLRQLNIAQIAESYLAYLDCMRDMRLNIASEYLVMAATLIHLKSLALLPRLPTVLEEEGGLDPTQELARRLIEYRQYKEASEALSSRLLKNRDFVVREAQPMDDADKPIAVEISAFGLLELYFQILQRSEAPPPVHLVESKGPDLATSCKHVLNALQNLGGKGHLDGLLRAIECVSERIVAFIGTLEMVRLGWLGIAQEEHLGAIAIWRIEERAIDFEQMTGRVLAGAQEATA